jgi:16S rRNA processing protein RimM
MGRTVDSTSSTDGHPGRAEGTERKRVVVGRILGAHGLRGQLRVRSFADDAENLLQLPRVILGEGEEDPEAATFEVARLTPARKGELRMALKGVTSRAAAEAFRGALVMAEAAWLGPLPEGEFYGFQLLGCRLEGVDGGVIGTVREIWDTGAPDVLVVEAEDGREYLVPAARELLREVDVAGRRIVIEVIPGLLDPS